MRKEINIGKAIAIILVLLVHIELIHHPFITLIRMPFYFFVSGIFYYKRPINKYFKKKFIHLMVPYISYLLILSSKDIICSFYYFVFNPSMEIFIKYAHIYYALLFGGIKLPATRIPFWFITVLFLTQQCYNILVHFIKSKWILNLVVFFCYILALFNEHWFGIIQLPLSANSVFFALLLFHVGSLYGDFFLNNKKVLVFSMIISIISYVLCINGVVSSFDIRLGCYGIPFLSLFFSIFQIVFFIYVCMLITKVKYLSNILFYMGSTTMTIYFCHLFIYFYIDQHYCQNKITLFFLVLTICIIIHYIINKKMLTKIFLLGDYNLYIKMTSWLSK